jgi:hypothetical protein
MSEILTKSGKLWVFERFRTDPSLPKRQDPGREDRLRELVTGIKNDPKTTETGDPSLTSPYRTGHGAPRFIVANSGVPVARTNPRGDDEEPGEGHYTIAVASGSLTAGTEAGYALNQINGELRSIKGHRPRKAWFGRFLVQVLRPIVWLAARFRSRLFVDGPKTPLGLPASTEWPEQVGDPAQAPPPTITVDEFFGAIKAAPEEAASITARAESYKRAANNARAAGQKALLERLAEQVEVVRAETRLFALGLRRVLTEATVAELVKKAPRGLRLDWVANFARPIEDPKVLATKAECDARLVFDNYAVLHYDPAGKGHEMTKVEKEAARDPILFGVIEGSRKLYYVGDWVDEYCDLTMEKVVEMLGERVASQDDL